MPTACPPNAATVQLLRRFFVSLILNPKQIPDEMLHKIVESFLPTLGFSTGLAFVSLLFAQEDSLDRWGSVGAAAVITGLFAYIITKRDPLIQEKQTELIKDITTKHTTSMENLQQETALVIQGIVKDHKELMESTIAKLIDEKKFQRETMHSHCERQLERVITYFDLQMQRITIIVRGDDCDLKSQPKGNDKGGES